MSVVLHELNYLGMTYLDDIIKLSPTLEEHIKNIQKVFYNLR